MLREIIDDARNNKLAYALLLVYCALSAVEVTAEYLDDRMLIIYTKPFLMPVLVALYSTRTTNPNFWFIFALCSSWAANIIFVSTTMDHVIWGSVFFLSYKAIVVYLVLKFSKLPGIVPLFIGCLPFLFIYLFVINLTGDELGDSFYLFVVHGIFTIIFGGLALGNYIFRPNKSNTYLLISTMLFTFTQFLFVIRLFYLYLNVFQSLAMALFVAAQFMLYKYIILEETKLQKQMVKSSIPADNA